MNISTQFSNIMNQWTDEVVEKVSGVLLEVGNDVADRFKTLGDFENRTGKYRKSWKVQTENRRTFEKMTVYASGGQHVLTHLLEYGHAKRGGGRTNAFPHVSINNEIAEEEAYQKIMKVIEETSR